MKKDKEMCEWSLKVKQRDGFKCVICGNPDRPNAHHILPRELKDTKYNINNGISLCPSHHRFNRQLSAHQNPMAFYLWMAKNKAEQLNYILQKIDLPKFPQTFS